ncbi:hypothetical protein PMAYCL1PPCAC_26937 [Pristionchus mayeri]|uniref:Bub-3 n=1 Tax=Pristionchus mayeri TaxID=1317129 RepID=A0AAN5I8P9_9BILA|nr:hypothetical protein PMAYCL1PPCAC_26937 [Pristionchus mayeri]
MYSAPSLHNSNEFRLPFPTHVGISKVQWCHERGSNLLAVSAWDGTVRVFDVKDYSDSHECGIYYHGKPALCCTFVDHRSVASGGADFMVKMMDIEGRKDWTLGQHAAPVRCMEYSARLGYIATGSWDSSVKLWDPRAQGGAVQTGSVSDKVYAMDTKGDKLIVATRSRVIHIYDVRSMREPEQTRESPLKYQTRALSIFPSGDAFVVSSIEGRVAVEYVDPNENQRKYAFKCHRTKDSGDGSELIFPVNAIAFHPHHNTFASGGSDAVVNLWDPFNRKRLVQLHKFDTTIASLSFSSSGDQLAIASSYGYEQETDPMPMPDNTITIRRVADAECRPRS